MRGAQLERCDIVIPVGTTPLQSVDGSRPASAARGVGTALLDELWMACGAAGYGLTRTEFDAILLRTAEAQNYGMPAGTNPATEQRSAWLRAVKAGDLVLAQACAAGNERAWEQFVALYHEPLVRAAIAIAGSDTVGRDLAGSLYAELYGMKEQDGKRKCPLESYRGRGSLMGWLRTTLAQRHVDHHRRTHREEPLETRGAEGETTEFDPPAPNPDPAPVAAELASLKTALEHALGAMPAEDRLIIAEYYLDGRTLAQIAQLLRVHEATISRRVRRIVDELRKQVLRNLQRTGLSRRAAEEALGADPRDLDVNLKKLLQPSQPGAFHEGTGAKIVHMRQRDAK